MSGNGPLKFQNNKSKVETLSKSTATANESNQEAQRPKVERKDSKVPHLFPEAPQQITHTHDDDTDSEESTE